MNSQREDRCLACDGEEDRVSLSFLESYELYCSSKILQKIAMHVSTKLREEISSLCQELDAADKKIKPIREKNTLLYENFIQEKAGKSLMEANFKEASLCKACEDLMKEIKEREGLNEKNEELREELKEIFAKLDLIWEPIKNEIGEEKIGQIGGEEENKAIDEALADIKRIINSNRNKKRKKPDQDTNSSSTSSTTSEPNTPSDSNKNTTIYWVLGSIVGIGIIGGIAFWLIKDKKKR